MLYSSQSLKLEFLTKSVWGAWCQKLKNLADYEKLISLCKCSYNCSLSSAASLHKRGKRRRREKTSLCNLFYSTFILADSKYLPAQFKYSGLEIHSSLYPSLCEIRQLLEVSGNSDFECRSVALFLVESWKCSSSGSCAMQRNNR